MQIADDVAHRVLAYIDALNRNGHRPMRPDVDEYAAAPSQMVGQVGGVLSSSLMAYSQFSRLLEGFSNSSETYCKYLERVGWITDEFEVQLTPTGRALLKALNVPVLEGTSDVIQVVLDPKSPFTYAQALEALSTVEVGLLIDPFLGLEELTSIYELGNVDRILINAPGKSAARKKACTVLAAALSGVAAESHQVEVRLVESGLHDRYLIPAETGRALMLGTSLNGVGKKLSTLTSLDPVTTSALRDHYEAVWKDAKVLKPSPLNTQS